jgi:protein subunit release factor B
MIAEPSDKGASMGRAEGRDRSVPEDLSPEDYCMPESDEALLAECDVETFRASGPGGQHVNRRETAVRLRHRSSGIVVSSQDERSQFRNKQIALARLRKKLEERSRPSPVRIPTSVPRRVRRSIREFKRRRALKKHLRRRPGLDE